MRFLFIILNLTLLTGCLYKVKPKKLIIERMKLEIEITPETGNGGYSISWNDTLCPEFKSNWDYLQKRPYELYCYITNSNNDTLGYYYGLSSPRQFTYFQTNSAKDSIINLGFLVGVNHFSGFLAEQTQDYINQFNENNEDGIEFELIRLNLSEVARKKTEIELIK